MDPNQYASIEPLGPDALLEKGTEYQRQIDGLEAELDDLKSEVSEKKADMTRFQNKVAAIFHARESGQDLYQLRGGELTSDPPDEDTLPLGEPPPEAVDTPVEEGSLPLEEESGVQATSEYPEEEAGQVYQGKSSAGNTCTVKETKPGNGKWTGRVSGKPVAIEQTLPEAFRIVEEHVGDTGDIGIDWKPTLEIEAVDEDEVDAELEGVDL